MLVNFSEPMVDMYYCQNINNKNKKTKSKTKTKEKKKKRKSKETEEEKERKARGPKKIKKIMGNKRDMVKRIPVCKIKTNNTTMRASNI
jgi:hypothetical protein